MTSQIRKSLVSRLKDQNWKRKRKTSLKRSYYGDFYKKLAFHFSKENKIRIYLLQLNEKYIAGLYSIIDQGICYLIKSGEML